MKKRILVVEDHIQMQQALKLYLETMGYEVILAEDVASGHKMAEEIGFDVLVCDLNLPDGTGWELLCRLNEKRPVPAVALSGWGSEGDIAKSKAAGFFAHLVKPINPEELVETIEGALEVTPNVIGSESFQARKKDIAIDFSGPTSFAPGP